VSTGRTRAAFASALLLAALAAPSHVAAGLLLTAGAARLALAAGRRLAAWRAARTGQSSGGGAGAVALGIGVGGRGVTLGDDQLAAHALILGASGAGKTTTVSTILADRIARGRPVVAIDMKGSPAFAAQLQEAATRSGRRLRTWTIDGAEQWNPLAHGNPTALKDMLMSSERFTEPHYRRAAERYLQNALTVLQAAAGPGRQPQLTDVVAAMEPRRLGAMLRRVPVALAERVGDYLGGLSRDQENAARGLGTRLAVLTESSAGPWLAPSRDHPGIDLRTALEGGDVVLFSLNSSVYGQLAAQTGALAIQGLTSAAGHRLTEGVTSQATIAIDEFSALGADNVLALLARGREAGATVLLATQELADLERAAPGFRDQAMGIVGTTIAHRQDIHASATAVSQLVGTEWTWEQTRMMRGPFPRPGTVRGTERLTERPVVHPNAIKRLSPGQALVVTKLPRAGMDWVAVTAPPRTTAARRGDPAVRGSPGRRPPPDHPAPGVTR
jgi:hypothetical protein